MRGRELSYNNPRAEPDFEFWGSRPFWRVKHEAVAISLGKDPRVVTYDNLVNFREEGLPFVDRFLRRHDDIIRANAMGDFGECNAETVIPSVFLNWAQDNKLDCPEALIEEVKKSGGKLLSRAQFELQTCKKLKKIEGNYLSLQNLHEKTAAEKDAEILELKRSLSEAPKSTKPTPRQGDMTKRIGYLEQAVAAWALDLGYNPNRKSGAVTKILNCIHTRGGTLEQTALRDIIGRGLEKLDR